MTIWRILNVLAVCALVAAAVVVYRIKYQATWQAEEVARLQSTIEREKANIALLQAVLAHLERPDRIELLAAKYLDLKPFDAHQRESVAQLPMRPPQVDLIGKTIASLDLDAPIKAAPHDDPIARTIESLGLAGPTRDRSIERSLKALGMGRKAASP
jgi:cell division protein FtsL